MPAATATREAIIALLSSRSELSLRVVPGARVEKAAIENGALKIWLRTPPEDGKANKAVLAILAKLLEIAVVQLEITHGHSSRDKRVRVLM
jgi:uncharacterized protein